MSSDSNLAKCALPQIVQNFQYSGMDSNDISFNLKQFKFPNQRRNVDSTDYVEVYAQFTADVTISGANANLTSQNVSFALPADYMTSYIGVLLNIGEEYDSLSQQINSQEFCDQMNELLKQKVQVQYETTYDGYTYDDSLVTTTQGDIYYHVYNLLSFCTLQFDTASGKMQLAVDNSGDSIRCLNFYSGSTDTVYLTSDGTATPITPEGTFESGTLITSFDITTVELQIHPGRNLTEERQYRIGQMLGADMRNFSYTSGQLCGSYATIRSAPYILSQGAWNADIRGTFPGTFNVNGDGLMDAQPVKVVHLYGGLLSNKWAHTGAKRQHFATIYLQSNYGSETPSFETNNNFYNGKDSIFALRNGFDLEIRDEFGSDPQFIGKWFLEIAFNFYTHNMILN